MVNLFLFIKLQLFLRFFLFLFFNGMCDLLIHTMCIIPTCYFFFPNGNEKVTHEDFRKEGAIFRPENIFSGSANLLVF